MQFSTVLKKMKTELSDKVQYYLTTDNNFINFNQILGRTIEINFEGYECLCCGKAKKIFRQGFCYDCFYASAAVGDWIMKPELSTAHLGIEDRDLEYEKKVQLQPHIVYLALSSNVKVGVTRKTQVPTRWIDQGASKAIEIVEVPNRYLAGITEVALKNYVADKTSWQKMLKNNVAEADLIAERDKLKSHIPEEAKSYFLENNNKVTEINYPVVNYPTKVKSLSLDKTPFYSGKLIGVKGQYLMFEDSTVFNVRNSEGYKVTITISE
ncbi:DUF2797 domain-containing protein [Lutibacter sp. TH_r2]|uniref:DUF2797 domain-containing protein n=1 Tax=Lutibacter sp. TH_r2 TaxID=3082083 RepID=UPI002952E878|nr:DUF2797 domain-containing protein [Lutibacter sp. TH_r2]MDV7186978.1 DUF2797 domain-containing protein [Lutibacter sp. TH_r2]